MSLEDHDAHPSDRRWRFTAGAGARPSIVVISRPEQEELDRRRHDAILRDDLHVERVPFGFSRELLLDDAGLPLCGFPHARNPRMFGGCIKRHAHQDPHAYRSGPAKGAIRPHTQPRTGDARQKPGMEEPPQ